MSKIFFKETQLVKLKWRWILFDTDRGFGLYNPNNVNTNMFDLVTDNTKYPSAIFNNLVNNENFRNKFLIAFSDYSNSIFQPDSLIKKINYFESLISNEIPRHIQRWRINGGTFEAWKSNVNELRDFANVRLPIMKEHLMSEFNLSVTSSLKIINHNPESSEIKLNSLTISKLPWSGSYFNSIPISLTIHTKPGYRFLGWKIADSSNCKFQKLLQLEILEFDFGSRQHNHNACTTE